MDTDPVRIRGYQPGDLDALYRICLLTANAGRDATPLYSDPRLPGEIYAAPYGVFEPGLAFVAEDRNGVGGYVLGALDTAAFEQRLERDWWPGLRLRYPALPPAESAALSQPEQLARHDIHQPWRADDRLTRRFPSHLHIDLLPRLQGRGLGRAMMETMLAALRARGSRGVHLFVSPDNDRAIAFYRHLGLAKRPESNVFVLDLTGAPGGSG